MQIVRSIDSMQRLGKSWQRKGWRIGLVPTMGYLHQGHLSLVARARKRVGADGKIVVSVYVNPTQFGPHEDFSKYPRNLRQDIKACRDAGADVLFAPNDREMYGGARSGTGPKSSHSTFVLEETLSRRMEGASRPTHFRGVTTVVAKLFNIVQPSVAVFGAKDYQQAAIIQRMVHDLNFPLKIDVAPIYREPDGLAMSSRNQYLKGNLRAQATVLWRAIERVHARLRDSSRQINASQLKLEVRKIVQNEPAARLDYIEFFDPVSLEPVGKIRHGTHMALAVFLGKTRLIDNARL